MDWGCLHAFRTRPGPPGETVAGDRQRAVAGRALPPYIRASFFSARSPGSGSAPQSASQRRTFVSKPGSGDLVRLARPLEFGVRFAQQIQKQAVSGVPGRFPFDIRGGPTILRGLEKVRFFGFCLSFQACRALKASRSTPSQRPVSRIIRRDRRLAFDPENSWLRCYPPVAGMSKTKRRTCETCSQ